MQKTNQIQSKNNSFTKTIHHWSSCIYYIFTDSKETEHCIDLSNNLYISLAGSLTGWYIGKHVAIELGLPNIEAKLVTTTTAIAGAAHLFVEDIETTMQILQKIENIACSIENSAYFMIKFIVQAPYNTLETIYNTLKTIEDNALYISINIAVWLGYIMAYPCHEKIKKYILESYDGELNPDVLGMLLDGVKLDNFYETREPLVVIASITTTYLITNIIEHLYPSSPKHVDTPEDSIEYICKTTEQYSFCYIATGATLAITNCTLQNAIQETSDMHHYNTNELPLSQLAGITQNITDNVSF